ncbi:MAG TPA: hypothetical protein VGD87_03200 [Archangium sp.]
MHILTSLVAGGLDIAVSHEAVKGLRLDWTGRCSHRSPSTVLRPYFEAVLQRAREHGCGIEAHFEQMEFFNSSTVTAIIHFIREARAQGTGLTITFDESQRWQALSFDALKSLELPDGLLEIRAVGEPARES